jgi:hypothetical protein
VYLNDDFLYTIGEKILLNKKRLNFTQILSFLTSNSMVPVHRAVGRVQAEARKDRQTWSAVWNCFLRKRPPHWPGDCHGRLAYEIW